MPILMRPPINPFTGKQMAVPDVAGFDVLGGLNVSSPLMNLIRDPESRNLILRNLHLTSEGGNDLSQAFPKIQAALDWLKAKYPQTLAHVSGVNVRAMDLRDAAGRSLETTNGVTNLTDPAYDMSRTARMLAEQAAQDPRLGTTPWQRIDQGVPDALNPVRRFAKITVHPGLEDEGAPMTTLGHEVDHVAQVLGTPADPEALDQFRAQGPAKWHTFTSRYNTAIGGPVSLDAGREPMTAGTYNAYRTSPYETAAQVAGARRQLQMLAPDASSKALKPFGQTYAWLLSHADIPPMPDDALHAYFSGLHANAQQQALQNMLLRSK